MVQGRAEEASHRCVQERYRWEVAEELTVGDDLQLLGL